MRYFYLLLIGIYFLFAPVCNGEVVLQMVVVNPVDGEEMAVPVKVYLPAEVLPEHILDRGGFDVHFDRKEGRYYIYKEVKLVPGDYSRESIEIKDIWKIPDEELKSVIEQAEGLWGVLEGSNIENEAGDFYITISSTVEKIYRFQSVAPVDPAEHIEGYRRNLKEFLNAERSLGGMRELVRTNEIAERRVSTFRIISIILGGLGVLAGVFFISWFGQSLKQRRKDSEADAVLKKYKVVEM